MTLDPMLAQHFEARKRSLAAQLDYPGTPLRIVLESEVDLLMRVPCCAKEPEMCAWITANVQRGDVLYDVGANVGSYSLIAASLGANVYAFEPVPTNFRSLARNVDLNRLGSKITVLPIALSDDVGLLRIRSDAENVSGTNARRDVFGDAAVMMPMDALGSLGIARPTLIKVDVEGMELLVLAGGEECIKGVRSAMIECTERTREKVEAWMSERGLVAKAEHPRIEPGTTNVEFLRPPFLDALTAEDHLTSTPTVALITTG